MIVDDTAYMRNALKTIIEDAGHRVVGTASGGHEAIVEYRRLKPDLVTMDILMPEMSGLQALESIRLEFPTAKVLMVTAVGEEQKQREAARLGAAGYIKKPFSKKMIVEELNRVLRKRAA